jgi:toxin ParE1/3/4
MSAYFTPQAEIDLEEIGDYIALDNPASYRTVASQTSPGNTKVRQSVLTAMRKRAVRFIQEIRQHCEQIMDDSTRYVDRPDLGEAIRICAYGNYLIVFEPYDGSALILRVLHRARNLSGIFSAS